MAQKVIKDVKIGDKSVGTVEVELFDTLDEVTDTIEEGEIIKIVNQYTIIKAMDSKRREVKSGSSSELREMLKVLRANPETYEKALSLLKGMQ